MTQTILMYTSFRLYSFNPMINVWIQNVSLHVKSKVDVCCLYFGLAQKNVTFLYNLGKDGCVTGGYPNLDWFHWLQFDIPSSWQWRCFVLRKTAVHLRLRLTRWYRIYYYSRTNHGNGNVNAYNVYVVMNVYWIKADVSYYQNLLFSIVT